MAVSGKSIFDVIGSEPVRVSAPPLQMPAPAQPKKMGKGQMIAGILADALAGAMGQPAQFAAMQMRQRQAEDEEAQWSRRQQAELGQYEQKKQIDQRYDKPAQDDQFTRYLAAAGIDPLSDQGKALYRQRVESIANPPRYMTGPNGEVLLVNGGGAPAPAAPRQPRTFGALPPGAVPIPSGGPTLPASGGFRR